MSTIHNQGAGAVNIDMINASLSFRSNVYLPIATPTGV